MLKLFIKATFLLFIPLLAFGRVEVQKISTQEEAGAFITKLQFNRPVDDSKVSIEFINQTIQVNIPEASLPQKKHLIRVDKGNVKSVYSYQESANNLRSRIIYKKPIKVSSLKPHVKIYADKNILKVVVDKKGDYIAKLLPQKTNFAPPFDLNKELEKALKPLEATKKLAVESKNGAVSIVAKEMNLAKKETIASKKEEKELKESEIPVLVSAESKEKSGSFAYKRMLYSLAVVVITGLGILVLARWWGKSNKKSLGNNKIRVITQHHLSPKKSLTIVQVAGEHILLGVTDQNISMIKTLALIEDDFPEVMPSSFSQSLKNSKETPVKVTSYGSELNDEADDFSIGHVKDVVSKKLKDLRTL